jgi:septum formation protein
LGYDFESVASHADETLPAGVGPVQAARTLAIRKARAVAAVYPDAVVIGADTLVVCGKQIFGKPNDAADAMRMLRLLSGRSTGLLLGCA